MVLIRQLKGVSYVPIGISPAESLHDEFVLRKAAAGHERSQAKSSYVEMRESGVEKGSRGGFVLTASVA